LLTFFRLTKSKAPGGARPAGFEVPVLEFLVDLNDALRSSAHPMGGFEFIDHTRRLAGRVPPVLKI
jgi:hypothetical protein